MRIVIKVGTSTLTYASGALNIRHIEAFCKVLSDIKNQGHEIIVVSSGAIAMGIGKLGLKSRPEDVPTRQAAAAVGQCELMYAYDRLFLQYNHTVAQILITNYIVGNSKMACHFKNTVNRLLEMGAVPIINENDTVATDELCIGDNDTLAAIVTEYTAADLLILLSDIEGLYTADPHKCADAMLIDAVDEIDGFIKSLAGGAGSTNGTGGMVTKIRAAEICMSAGCDMVIANGADPEIIYNIIEGKKVGTRFIGRK